MGNVTFLTDTDNDLSSASGLDYREDLNVSYLDATIDFDGVDDYIDTDSLITNWTNDTIMSWVKIEYNSDGNFPNLYSIDG